MVLRDRGFQRRALSRITGPDVAEMNPGDPAQAAVTPFPGSTGTTHQAGDAAATADRPRSCSSTARWTWSTWRSSIRWWWR